MMTTMVMLMMTMIVFTTLHQDESDWIIITISGQWTFQFVTVMLRSDEIENTLQKLEIPIIRTKTDTSLEFSCHYS